MHDDEEGSPSRIRDLLKDHGALDVYKLAFQAANEIFEVSKGFPREETYSLTNQMRRSSRSVCANIAEAWRKRRYEAAFVSKLNEAEAEAAETQTWLRFAQQCQYMTQENASTLDRRYDRVIGKLVRMIANPRPWVMERRR